MDRIEVGRVARVLAPYVALWLVVAAGLLAFQVYELDRHRSAELEAGGAEAQNLALVMSQHVAQVLESTDRTLTLAKLFHERKVAALQFSDLADAMRPIMGTEAERRINFFDRDGRMIGSTDPEFNSPRVSISDRGYFAAAKAGSGGSIFIGEPVFGRVSRMHIIPVAKRLLAPDDQFDGVVAMAVDPQRLVRMFRAMRHGEQSAVGIAHRDGPVVAWARAGSAGTDAPAPQSIGEVVQSGQVIKLAEVHGSELLAFASLSEDDLLADHRRYRLATMAFTATTLAAITLPIWWIGARAWRDVHRRRVLELRYASAYQQARTDALTGLANRTGFDEARREADARQKDDGVPFALAFIDIDHFKRLNDTLGHDVGDEALRRVGETLSGGVRQSDAVGRLGGDEFAVLMPGVTGGTMHRRFDPIKIDLDAMAKRYGWPIGFSIGVVAYETPTHRGRDAVNFADRMMYDVKEAGRDGIRYAVYRDGRLIPEEKVTTAAVA